MNVHIFRLGKHKSKTVLDWCEQQYKDVAKVHSPTTVELHRVCYDASLPGILVLYFRDERDYLFFSLRWI